MSQYRIIADEKTAKKILRHKQLDFLPRHHQESQEEKASEGDRTLAQMSQLSWLLPPDHVFVSSISGELYYTFVIDIVLCVWIHDQLALGWQRSLYVPTIIPAYLIAEFKCSAVQWFWRLKVNFCHPGLHIARIVITIYISCS